MLTIERDRKLSLRLRPKDKFWNKTLVSALALALLLHLSAFLVFKVRPISAAKSKRTLLPVSVAMEPHGTKSHHVTAAASDEPLPNDPLPIRPEQKPVISSLATAAPLKSIDFGDQLLARRRKIPPRLPHSAQKETKHPSLLLLGNLSDRSFTSAIDERQLWNLQEQKSATYEVTVDDQTGSIVWIAPSDDLGLVLSELQLNQRPGQTLTKGILEVQFK